MYFNFVLYDKGSMVVIVSRPPPISYLHYRHKIDYINVLFSFTKKKKNEKKSPRKLLDQFNIRRQQK